MLDLQLEQMKQSLCQCLPSKEMNLVPPIPEVRGAGSMHIGIYAYREHAYRPCRNLCPILSSSEHNEPLLGCWER